MSVDRERDHVAKMAAADERLNTLQKRKEKAAKMVAAAERKYNAYGAAR